MLHAVSTPGSHSVCAVERIVRGGGCPVVRSALAAQARGPGFNSQWLPA